VQLSANSGGIPVTVNCDKGESLNRALSRLNNHPAATVSVKGTCTEYVQVVGFDNLTLNGLPGAALVQPSTSPGDLGTGVLLIGSSRSVIINGLSIQGDTVAPIVITHGSSDIRLENLNVRGGDFGIIIVEHSQALLSHVVGQNAGYTPLGIYDASDVHIEHCLFDNPSGAPWHAGISMGASHVTMFDDTIRNMQVGIDGYDAIVDLISTTNCIQGFGFLKPHGYAGDYEIIDRIYTGWVSDDLSLRKWDEYFHVQPAPRAVRNRKAYFHRVLDRLKLARPIHRVHVLNVGSGPARDVYEYLAQSNKFRFECIDLDTRAIEFAKCLCRSYQDRVVFRRENVLRLCLDRQFDLIWSAGLFDYLADQMFLMVLRRLVPIIRPSGELVIGNFSKDNPSRYWMEAVGDWKLHHRTESELRALAHAAGVDDQRLSIGAEPEGVNLFLHIRGCELA
jgi:SAM-dependent methyltransferase